MDKIQKNPTIRRRASAEDTGSLRLCGAIFSQLPDVHVPGQPARQHGMYRSENPLEGAVIIAHNRTWEVQYYWKFGAQISGAGWSPFAFMNNKI
jgi:hypothetical protein